MPLLATTPTGWPQTLPKPVTRVVPYLHRARLAVCGAVCQVREEGSHSLRAATSVSGACRASQGLELVKAGPVQHPREH